MASPVVKTALLLASALAAGCAVDPDAARDRGTRGDEPAVTIEARTTDVACAVSQVHGGSLVPESFATVLGCACKPQHVRDHFNVWNIDAGSCMGIGWASDDPSDCRVNVLINNSGGFLNGTCNVEVDEAAQCPHDRCTTGDPLATSCTGVRAICAADSYCCTTAWDQICVGEVRSVTNSLVCPSAPCPHAECTTGVAMPSTCSSPVTQICASDPYCCTTSWDSICVGEVASITGNNCN